MSFIWVPEYISRYLDFNSAPLFSDVQNGQIIGDCNARVHDFDDGGAAKAVDAFDSIRVLPPDLASAATRPKYCAKGSRVELRFHGW
jgi:hypothetical protein